MAANSLEDLLQEALADFDELQQGPDVSSSYPVRAEVNASSPSAAGTTQTPIGDRHVKDITAPPPPQKPAPKGLGLGLGLSDLPGRRPRKPASATAPAAGSEIEIEGATEGHGDGDTCASVAAKAQHKLPAEAQRLADDLMSLLQEAGLGESSEQPHADALSACLADLMGTAGKVPAAANGLPAELDADAPGLPRLGPGVPGSAAALGDADDPFAQLFGRIMGGLAPPSGAGGDAEGPPPPPPEFAAMLQEMMGAAGLPGNAAEMRPPGPAAGPGGTPGAGPSGFTAPGGDDDDDALASSRLAGLAQRTRKTVSEQAKKTRGHVEGAAAGRAGAGPGAGAGLFGPGAGGGGIGGLASMLRELGGLGMAGGGGEGDESAPPAGVGVMVDYIMQHLLSKDVLYGPLKDIRDRYPPWLEAHQGTLPVEEYRRYVAQYESVQRVCAHYEASPPDFAKLMDLIQEMQMYGDPPGDIVEEMTGGAGRDINAILDGAGEDLGGPAGRQPALEEFSSELDNCKVQ